MNHRICITGIGIVNPSGVGKKIFWDNISKGVNSIRKITRFDASGFPVEVAGEVTDFKATQFIPRRLAVKMDTFSHYACAAASMAIEDSGLNLPDIDPYKIGVWLGNNSGGWDICEQGLYELYRDGPELVNPWQATAWFLSSAQGYVSIANGIKGMSKTFCSDRTSSAAALHFAAKSIELGRCDLVLAGGCEAPLSPFGLTCYCGTGDLAYSGSDITSYRPFDVTHNGLVLGEGGSVVILESMEHALERGAHIYGELAGTAMTNDCNGKSSKYLTVAMHDSLKKAKLSSEEVEAVFPEGAATEYSDLAEASAIQDCFKAYTKLDITCPKSGFGHLYGASTVTDLICGLLSSENNLIPPTPNTITPYFELSVVHHSKSVSNLNNFMIISRAREGGNGVLVVKTNLK